MKIYREIRIDIETGETLYEDSFEYEGEIAHCGPSLGDWVPGLGLPTSEERDNVLYGEDPSVSYSQSPEQSQMFQMFMPVMQQIVDRATGGRSGGQSGALSGVNAGVGNLFDPSSMSQMPGQGGGKGGSANSTLWDIPDAPNAPTAPSMQGVYSGVPGANFQGYDVTGPNVGSYNTPGVGGLMPQQGWYDNMDSSIKSSLNEPWNAARSSMFETLGGQGNLGSARGGFSGAAGAALGEFESNRANQVGMQAWNMMQPGLTADYNAQLGRNRDVFGAQTNADMWQAGAQTDANKYLTGLGNQQSAQMRGERQQENFGDYSNQITQQQQDFGLSQETWRAQREEAMFPYTVIPSMMGGTYSSPVVNPGSPGMMQNLPLMMMMGKGGR